MRARPLHPDPSVPPPPRQPSQPHSARPATSSTQVLGTQVPQVMVDYKVARHIAAQVAKQREELLKTSPDMDRASEEQRCLDWINEAVALWSDANAMTPHEDEVLRRAVYDLLFRAGRLQPYLDDERVEDIIIQGPDEVWLDYGDGERRMVGAIADSEEELLELLRELAATPGTTSGPSPPRTPLWPCP